MDEMIPTSLEEERLVPAAGWLARLEVADGFYALILVAAAIVRLVDLGRLPLSPNEAEAALAPWQLWQPGIEVGFIGSPVYFTLSSLLTQLLGYTDAVMRFVPVIFGLGVVCLPWFLRKRLGRIGVLAYGLALAVSPLGTVVARTAGGEMIALFCILLVFVAWLRYRETAERRWLNTLYVAVALGLTSAPLFYGGLLSLAVAAAIYSTIGPSRAGLSDTALPERHLLSGSALIGGIVFVAASTMFLWFPAGMGASMGIPVRWLAQFSFQGGLQAILDPLLAVGRYEPMLLLSGPVAIIWAITRRKPLGRFCVLWMALILAQILVQWGQLDYALLLTLPGYLLLAEFIRDLLRPRVTAAAWALAGEVTLLGMLMFVNVARYSRVVVFEPQKFDNIWVSFIAFATLLVTIYFVLTWRVRVAYQGAAMGVLFILLFYQWGTGWWLGHFAANDPRERWVTIGTDNEVRLLAAVARDISRQSTGSDHGLDLTNMVDSPVLRWYLRDFSELSNNAGLPVGASDAIISQADATLSMPSDYLGADFGLLRQRTQAPESEGRFSLVDTLRWWLFHDSTVDAGEERVILWWRSDLIEGLNR
jgi:hypothetical protein